MKTLFLLGGGFDPRALKAIRRICGLGALPKVWLLAFESGQEDSPRKRELTVRNREALADLVGEGNIVETAGKYRYDRTRECDVKEHEERDSRTGYYRDGRRRGDRY